MIKEQPSYLGEQPHASSVQHSAMAAGLGSVQVWALGVEACGPDMLAEGKKNF